MNEIEALPFAPRRILKNPHIQTLYPVIFGKKLIQDYGIETFTLSDGDFVECYWYQKPRSDDTPIVTLFHGLAGSWRSHYIQRIMQRLGEKGFGVVLMHFRGCSGKPNNLPRSYHSGDTADARAWLTHLHTHFPKNPLYAAGYSLGGNMLLKLLGEWGDAALLQKAVAVSAPMQLDICARRMEKGFSRLYQYHLLSQLKADLLLKYRRFDMHAQIGLAEKDVKKLKTFREFDDAYTAPIHGFKDATTYYRKSSAKQYLKSITTDTLILHAEDDPFMTPEVLPLTEELSPSIKLCVSRHGGHVGFIQNGASYWVDDTICRYLKR